MRRIFLKLAIGGMFFCLATVTVPTSVRAQSDAAKIYKTNCVLCHAANGSGDSSSGKSLGAKDLRSPEVQAKSDAELTEFITAGKGKMPAFGKKLKAEDIKEMVTYIRDLAKKK